MKLEHAYVGASGPRDATIAFVGEAPGREEAVQGTPFVGPSGQVLWPWLKQLTGIERSEVYVTNWHKTMLSDDAKKQYEKDPTLAEPWSEALLEELSALPNLETVVALGGFALRALLPPPFNTYWANGLRISGVAPWTVVPVVHPAAGLHSPNMLQRTWQGLAGIVGPDWGGFRDAGKDVLIRNPRDLPVGDWSRVAIDTEGTADEPFCLSFSLDGERSYVIYASDYQGLREFYATIRAEEPTIYLHNALYDVDVLLSMGVDVRGMEIHDTALMANVLQDEPLDLKSLTMRHLAIPMTPYLEVVRPYQEKAVQAWRAKVFSEALKEVELELQFTPKGKPRRGKSAFKQKAAPHIAKIKTNYERGFKFALNEQKWGEARVGPMPGPDLELAPPEVHVPYAGKDARVTLALSERLMKRVRSADLTRVLDLDQAAQPLIGEMQRNGLHVDFERYHQVMAEISVEREALLDRLRQEVGEDFNPGSADQVEKALQERQYELTKLTASRKRYSTSENVLKILRERYDDTAFLDLLLEYREHDKYLNAYLLPLGQKITRTADGHRLYHRFGLPTVSGRLTGQVLTWPARTALGRKLRSIFTAPEGKLLVAWDLSQIELRLAAAFSGDELMTKAFTEGRDLHANLASGLFQKPYEECLVEPGKTAYRYPAKTIHYLLLYGGQGGRLYEELRGAGVTGYTEEQCQALINDTWKLYAGAGRFLQGKALEAKRAGFVRDFLGRRRFLPGASISPGRFGWVLKGPKLEAERQAGNFAIQAGAAEIIKRSMVRVWEDVYPQTSLRLWLQVHDELMGEIDEDDWDKVDPLMVDAMTQDSPLTHPVRIETEGAYGQSWDQLK